MQKVLRINLLARNQALKNTRRKNLKDLKKEWKNHDQTRIYLENEQNKLIRTERKARREDWAAGPLAPKRDIGTSSGVYGTVNAFLSREPEIPAQVRPGPKGNGWDLVGSEGLEGEDKEWEGEGNEGNIVQGDRVCVVAGKESLIGHIGVVKEVELKRRALKIANFNMVNTRACFYYTGIRTNLIIPLGRRRNHRRDPRHG